MLQLSSTLQVSAVQFNTGSTKNAGLWRPLQAGWAQRGKCSFLTVPFPSPTLSFFVSRSLPLSPRALARASYRISCLRTRQRAGQRRQNVGAPDSTFFVVLSLHLSNNGFATAMPAAAERCEHLCVCARFFISITALFSFPLFSPSLHAAKPDSLWRRT